MSRYDPSEQLRLERENEYLLEQVRTLTAELNERPRAEWLIATAGGGVSRRPPYETCASRVLLTDEMVMDAVVDAFGYASKRASFAIEQHAKGRRPLDHIWRLTLERDYVK